MAVAGLAPVTDSVGDNRHTGAVGGAIAPEGSYRRLAAFFDRTAPASSSSANGPTTRPLAAYW